MTPASALKLKKKAADFESKKQIDKALSLYIQLLDESGKDLGDADLQLYNRVGDLLTRQGNVAEALTWYEKAVDVYAERGFLNNAIALCNKVLRQSPSRSSVYYKLGKISASKGFKSDAKKNFLEYADRMQKAGRIDEAFRALKEFADLCPDQDDIRLVLADWLAKENRKSEAVEQLETLYSKLEAEGRSAEARATIDRIKAIDPDVVPRASGAWTSQKSSDLVFLDLVEDAPQPRHQAAEPAREATPARGQSPSVVPIVPALEGLTLTFHPDVDDAERASAAALEQLLQHAEGEAGSERSLASLGLQQEPGVGSPSPLDDAAPRVSDELVAIDLDAVLAQPPRLPTVSLEEELPLLPSTDDEAADAPAIDLLGIVGTPIGTPVILERAASLGGLEMLDLTDDWPSGASDEAAVGASVDDSAESPMDAPVEASVDAPVDASVEAPAPSASPDGEREEWVLRSGDHPLVEKGPDTSELIAIGDSSRVTDEILVVETETEGDAEAHVEEVTTPAAPILEGDVTPDAWIDAALGAGDDRSLDHLLTPLEVHDIATPADAAAVERQDEPLIAAPSNVPLSDIEAAKAEAADFDEYGPVKGAMIPREPLELPGEAVDMPSAAMEPEQGAAPGDVPCEAPGEAPDELPVDAPSALEAFFGAPHGGEADIDLLDELTPPFMRDPAAGHPEAPVERGDGEEEGAQRFSSGEVRSAIDDALPLGGEPLHVVDDASALDTSSLHAAIQADGRSLDAAFRDAPIELPMLDVGGGQELDDEPPYAPYDATERPTPADYGAQAPAFDASEELEESLGDPADESIPDDGWTRDHGWTPGENPEVLIDGEWHDEHVGGLMSGEAAALPDGSARPVRPSSPARFDDLSAAMLWPAGSSGEVEAQEDTSLAAGAASAPGEGAPRGGVSFGGVEAQLRQRLELEPANWGLRRQLGEELIGIGEREEGLAELESAMAGFEQLGDLEEARKVADSVLRAVPASVRHHQKRVEYAARSSDRPRLVEAYVELADALFRSGDADKAHVVYSRVLELSPSNQRARLALGLTAPDEEQAPHTPGESASSPNRASAGTAARFTAPGGAPAASAAPAPSPPAALAAPALSPPAPVPAPDGLGASRQQFEAPHAGEAADVEARHPADAPPRLSSPDAAAAGGNDGFIDLGDWLRAAEPVRSTRMITTDVAPTGDEQADFDDMLRRFKQGVAENVDEEDFASHYDLGVAFKEMGLVDEAISEFQKSLRGDEHRVRSYEALGQCFVEKQQMQVASTLLRRAVESTGADDQQLVGVLFLLGFANESMGRHVDALGYYQRVFAVDIEFRDVAKRVAAMEHRIQ